MFELLLPPLVACLILIGIHCYFGIHILMREIIFVDLALAQVAALGLVVGIAFGYASESQAAYLFSLSFALLGALTFALGRFRDRRVPQEAIIGIVYVASAAVVILILSQTAIERDHVEQMLTGRLLYVDWREIATTTGLYIAVAAIHVVFRRPFFEISTASRGDAPLTVRIVLWDFLFYATFGLVVTSSVRMAGVLLVFSFLVVPAACAFLFFAGLRSRLLAGWMFGLLGSAAGLVMSAGLDLPTGASVTAAFGALFLLCVLAYAVVRRTARPRRDS